MKGRLFVVFALTLGLALLLTWVVVAQGEDVTTDIQSASSLISTGRAKFPSNHQSTGNLGHTSEITFTPAFTIYLPGALKGYGGCSTIPALISPTDGSNLSTLIPLLRWDSGNAPHVTALRLQIAQDPDFARKVSSLWYGMATGVGAWRFPFNLDPATTYYWRAWLLCGETEGPYSEVWSFTTGSGGTILPAPTLIAPANGSTLPSLPATLQWSAVDGTVDYLVQFRKVGEGGTGLTLVTETQTQLSWLDANSSYEWWVSARNSYAYGEDSEIWQFTTPAESSSVSTLDLNRFVLEDGVTTVFEERETR